MELVDFILVGAIQLQGTIQTETEFGLTELTVAVMLVHTVSLSPATIPYTSAALFKELLPTTTKP